MPGSQTMRSGLMGAPVEYATAFSAECIYMAWRPSKLQLP